MWENPNPTSEMAESTISIDTKQYKLFLLSVSPYIVSSMRVYIICPIDKLSTCTCAHNVNRYRNFTVSANSLVVRKGSSLSSYGGSFTDNNQACIPIQLYGIH